MAQGATMPESLMTDKSINEAFLANLRRELAGALPGIEAQRRLAPRPRAGWNPSATPPRARDASVLVLIYPHQSEWLLPLTRRTDTVADHRGQISFTGGARELDESVEATALREARDEIGLEPGQVEVLGRLTRLHIPHSNFVVTPIVGLSTSRPIFSMDRREVAEILEVPLALLLDPGTVVEESWRLASGEAQVPLYRVGAHKVWGATAMILA